MVRIPTFSQATKMVTPNKAKGQIVESNRLAAEQAALFAAQQEEYNRQVAEQQAAYQAQMEAYQQQMEEYNRRLQEQQAAAQAPAAEATPEPPQAQNIGSQPSNDDPRTRRRSNRGSLLAGDTGGYNPATGSSGRLGARSLLG